MVEQGHELKNAQAVFLAGRNEPLRTRVQALAKRAVFPTRVIGYTNAMEKLMVAADVMVSKLGGLTTFEALASRLPIIADTTTPPMPQESQTASLVARHRAGILLNQTKDIVPIMRRLLNDPAEHAAMKLAAAKIAIPDATHRIVKELMQKVEEHNPIKPLVKPLLNPPVVKLEVERS